jgi:hypothetical protein
VTFCRSGCEYLCCHFWWYENVDFWVHDVCYHSHRQHICSFRQYSLSSICWNFDGNELCSFQLWIFYIVMNHALWLNFKTIILNKNWFAYRNLNCKFYHICKPNIYITTHVKKFKSDKSFIYQQILILFNVNAIT